MITNTLINEILFILETENINSEKLNIIHMQLACKLSEYSFQKIVHEVIPYAPYEIATEIKEYLVCLKIAGLSLNTLNNYALELRLFQEFAKLPLCSVTSTHIMKYLYECNAVRKIADVTIEHKRIVINGFYNWLFLEHKVPENPCLRVKPIKCKTKILEPLTNYELEKMRLAAPTIRDKCLIEVLFSTGMRVSELISVNISSIDFTRKKLIILGKGSKERTIRFSDRTILLIHQYLESRADTNDALFVTSKKPHNRLSKAGIEYIVHHIASLSNIERISVTPHTFRRNHGLAIYTKTNDIYKASASLGHANISTTTKYIKLSDESLQQTFDYVMN